MHIQKVIIKNFRCFEHLEVNLDPDINIFVGNNGSGKSALLDAIAAAMYPYVVQIQQIAGKKYREASPVLQRDLPAKKRIMNEEIRQSSLYQLQVFQIGQLFTKNHLLTMITKG
jgi:predicted ATP-dependent endonuclease of OLD family